MENHEKGVNSYIVKYSFGYLISEFSKYTTVDKAELLVVFNFSEEDLNNFFESNSLTNQPDYILKRLFEIIDEKMTNEYFGENVPFDEIEYVWNIGRRIRLLILDEIYKRHPNTDIHKFMLIRKKD